MKNFSCVSIEHCENDAPQLGIRSPFKQAIAEEASCPATGQKCCHKENLLFIGKMFSKMNHFITTISPIFPISGVPKVQPKFQELDPPKSTTCDSYARDGYR